MSDPEPARRRDVHPPRRRRLAFILVTLVLACGVALAFLESGLRVVETRRPPEAAMVIPPEWARQDVDVPGAVFAYRWHGHLQVYNRDWMRTLGLYPPKPDGVFRILVVGDSLTYGEGVAAEDAYPALLDTALGPDVEVLNLGVSGAQSEDIAETVRQQFEEAECVKVQGLSPELQAIAPPVTSRMCRRYELEPDLIVYGLCLNDFLPSGRTQREHTGEWQIPVPGKRWLLAHSLST